METQIEIFKALSDKNRLLIIEMLSCGELCACDIMEGLSLTQPTISHHMKILNQSGLINCKKDGKWMKYSLNQDIFKEISEFIINLSLDKENCICKSINNSKCSEKE